MLKEKAQLTVDFFAQCIGKLKLIGFIRTLAVHVGLHQGLCRFKTGQIQSAVDVLQRVNRRLYQI